MMRKIKIFSVILFIVSAAAFGGCRIWDRFVEDHTAPVISGDEALEVSVTDSEEILLEGMTAEDAGDGDVTDSLVVQSISEFNEAGERTVNYAAVDAGGNVGYFSRTLTYTDYEKPVFALSAPLRFPMGTDFNICGGITASSTLDGDLTNKIKYTLDRSVSSSVTGTYQVEFRVSDSTGSTSYLATELEVYDPTEETGEVTLSSYLVYIGVNESFQASDYYSGTDIEDGSLDIQSGVDTSEAGVYTVDYIVTGGKSTGRSRLVVVVS